MKKLLFFIFAFATIVVSCQKTTVKNDSTLDSTTVANDSVEVVTLDSVPLE